MTRLPLYRDVKDKLIQALAAGEWPPGAKLPIEGELARRYGVGINTVRSAVAELESAGIVARMQGKGTFVAEHANQSRLRRFFNLVNADGTRETPLRAFVSLRKDRATRGESEFLKLSRYRDPAVYRLRTTFSLQQRNTAVNDVILPAALFPGLKKSDVVSEANLTLYALYQTHYNVNVVQVAADLTADIAPADIAKLLAIRRTTPLLRIERKAYTYSEIPVELRISWVNTSHCRFHVDQGLTD